MLRVLAWLKSTCAPSRTWCPRKISLSCAESFGLFVVSRKYLRDYALITRPLTDLLRGKQPIFKWGEAQQSAYEHVRDALLAGVHLAAPDFSLPFHLQTDASEDGKGAVLYQLHDCTVAEQYPYCKDKHSPEKMFVIAHYSKAFTEVQRLRPPYYLEADSLLWATNETKFYALDEPVPTTMEEWISEQNRDLQFLNQFSSLEGIACRQGLYLYVPDGIAPRILVPPATREPLIRFTHQRMSHLGHAKVAERLLRSYFWPSLCKDTRTTLDDCATCEIEKARQNLAHGLFRARPNEAPRTRYAMDFQGQGTAVTGETEALAIIDTTPDL
jgi:hypothetical protein